MQVIRDFGEYRPWSGAVSTYERIEEEGKLDQLESILEEIFQSDTVSEAEINDLLWFEPETVYEWLGITDEEDEDEDQ